MGSHRVLENNERSVLDGGALWSWLGQTAHPATLSLQMRDREIGGSLTRSLVTALRITGPKLVV